MSGAVPPLAVRPLDRAARVPRPVCPGCGRCGRGDLAPAPQRAPLRAGVARCGGGGRTSPGWPPSTIVRGVWCQALSLPRPSVLWGGQPGFRVPVVPGAGGAGVGTQHRSHSACALAGRRCSPWGWRKGVPGGGAFHRCERRPVSGAVPPLAARLPERAARVPRPVCPGCGRCGGGDPAPAPQRAPLRAGVARCGGCGRASPGGVLSTVARAAWCQALSLPRPPVLRSGQPGFRVPRVPGAVGAGAGIQHRPRSVRPCAPALLAAGVAEGRPRGGVLSTVVRAHGVRRCPSPGRPPSGAGSQGSASRVSRLRSVRAWGLSTDPQRAPLRAGVARCGCGGRASPGGVPSTVVRGAWCQALSLPRPPVLWSGQPGFRDPCVPGAVDAGVWTQHRPHSVRPCGPALPAVGVAEGRPRGGCLPPF